MEKTAYVNYNGLFEHSASVRCDCGHEFKFQSNVQGYCPSCGAKIIGQLADNIPMRYVPKGYKAYLFNMYDTYKDEYYHNTDHWSAVSRYQAVVYTTKAWLEKGHELTLEKLKSKFGGRVCEIAYGWAYVRGCDPIDVRTSNKYGDRLVYETKNDAIKTQSIDALLDDIIVNYNSHIAIIEKNC